MSGCGSRLELAVVVGGVGVGDVFCRSWAIGSLIVVDAVVVRSCAPFAFARPAETCDGFPSS